MVFAVVGVLLFAFLFNTQYANHGFFEALKNPVLIVVLIVPFFPAMILSWMASRLEKKLEGVVSDIQKQKVKKNA